MSRRAVRSSSLVANLTRAQSTVYVAAILLASLGASLVGYRYLHEQTRSHLVNLAQITAIESQAALIFDQDDSGAQVLQQIPSEEGVTRAELFDASGKLRASVSNKPRGFAGSLAGYFDGESATANVIADRHIIGHVRLQGGQEPLLNAFFGLIGSDILVVAFVGLLSVIVSRRNTRRITRPITQLRTIMRSAIEHRDFTQRAPAADITEVDDLRVEFNTLLDEIVLRDQTLRTNNALLRRLAFHDALTGLPNRAMFERALAETLIECASNPSTVALLYLDIDSFKTVNDTFGHAAGDALLIEIGGRLQRWLPDGAMAARLGGDEFVVLVSPWRSASDNAAPADEPLIKALQAMLEAPVAIGTQQLYPGVSVGVAIYPDMATDADGLVKMADKAMYQVKGTHYQAAALTYWK